MFTSVACCLYVIAAEHYIKPIVIFKPGVGVIMLLTPLLVRRGREGTVNHVFIQTWQVVQTVQ